MGSLVLMTKDNINTCSIIYLKAFPIKNVGIELEETLIKDSHRNYFNKCINDSDKYAYCYIAENEIVGFITAWNIPSLLNDFDIYIDTFAVTPDKQKNGYGTEMLRLFLETITKEQTVLLNTKKNFPAYKMYKNFNFIDEETTRMIRSPMLVSIRNEIEELQNQLKEKFPELNEYFENSN